jgi:hypothetical protein
MDMSGQLHDLAALPLGKDSLISIVGGPQRLSKRYGDEMISCHYRKWNPESLDRNIVGTLIELSRIAIKIT